MSLDPSVAEALAAFAQKKAVLDTHLAQLDALPRPDPFASPLLSAATQLELDRQGKVVAKAQAQASEFQKQDMDRLRALAKGELLLTSSFPL